VGGFLQAFKLLQTRAPPHPPPNPPTPGHPRPAGAPRILEALSSRQQGLVPSISRRKDLGFEECQKPVPLLLCRSARERGILQQLRGDDSARGLCGAKTKNIESTLFSSVYIGNILGC